MLLTKEMIDSLPVIPEEQLSEEYWDPDEFIKEGLAKFDKAIAEIDSEFILADKMANQCTQSKKCRKVNK